MTANIIRLIIKKEQNIDDACKVLQLNHYSVLYSTEDTSANNEIYLTDDGRPLDFFGEFSFVINAQYFTLPSIDWEEQWSEHAINFYDGLAHIDLEEYGFHSSKNYLVLKPGPGFGDLSHPTTLLMLTQMSGVIKNKDVLDVGCGSGILTIAALLGGAHEASGIDIDTDAIIHAKHNASLNNLKNTLFSLPDEWPCDQSKRDLLILINMIWSEQVFAWNSLVKWKKIFRECIASGIRSEESQAYVEWMKIQGWTLLSKQEKEGWSAFHFTSLQGQQPEEGDDSQLLPPSLG